MNFYEMSDWYLAQFIRPYRKALLIRSLMALMVTYNPSQISQAHDQSSSSQSQSFSKNVKDLRSQNSSVQYQSGDFPSIDDELTHLSSTPCYKGRETNTSDNSSVAKSEGILIPNIKIEDGKCKIIDAPNISVKEKKLVGGNEERRTRIKHPKTQEWPYRIHGHMIMQFPNGSHMASGILVGPNHVLTAGHNLYDNKKWATEIFFAPGRDEKHYPSYGDSKGCILLVPQEWYENSKDDYDFGMVILDSAIGHITGWSGLLCLPDDMLLKEWPVSITGYPGEKGVGNHHSTQMWTMTDLITTVKTEQLFYKIETSEGQSGSGICGDKWPGYDGLYIVGVHTGQEANNATENRGIKISREKFKLILSWLKTYQLQYSSPLPSVPIQEQITLESLSFLESLSQDYQSWVRRAKEEGEAKALYHLGTCYYKGGDLQKDVEKAFRCFYCAAKKNYGPALRSLGLCYEQGHGTEQHFLKALLLYKKAGVKEDAEAMRRLGLFYLQGIIFRTDSKVAEAYLKDAANQGDGEACYHLGNLYNQRTVDKERADQFYKQAEQLGFKAPEPQQPQQLTVPDRKWEPITNEIPMHTLPDRPSKDKWIDSKPEYSQKSYLTLLHEQLYHQATETSSTTIITNSLSKQSLTGMGGVGKSTLALTYAYEALDHKTYDFIYWLNSENEEALLNGYKDLLIDWEISLKDDKNLPALVRLVKHNITKRSKKWLLIYDNVPTPVFLNEKIPQQGGHILITSRCSEGWDYETITLDVFSPEDSINYLLKSLKLETTKDNKAMALSLAEELGYLPLALFHAVGYMNFVKTITMKEYLEEFKKSTINFIHLVGKGEEISYDHLVGKTWKMAEEIISKTPLAKELMIYFSYMKPDEIMPRAFINKTISDFKLKETLGILHAFSLVTVQGDFISIHRLVRRVIRKETESTQQFEKYVDQLLNHIFSDTIMNFDHFKLNNQSLSSHKPHGLHSTLPLHLVQLKKHVKEIKNAEKMSREDLIFLKMGLKVAQKSLQKNLNKFGDRFFDLNKIPKNKSNELISNNQNDLFKSELKAEGFSLEDKEFEELLSFLPSASTSQQRKIFFKEFCNINPQERFSYFMKIKSFLGKETINDWMMMIKALQLAPFNQHIDLLNIAESLMKVGAFGNENSKIIESLASINFENRQLIASTAKSLLAPGESLEHEENKIISYLNKIMLKLDKNKFESLAQSLAKHSKKRNESDYYLSAILDVLVWLAPENDYESLIDQVIILYNSEIDQYEKLTGDKLYIIIQKLKELNISLEEDTVQAIVKIMRALSPLFIIKGSLTAEIIKTITLFPSPSWDIFLDNVGKLLNKDMTFSGRADVVLAFAKVEQEKHDLFIKCTKDLLDLKKKEFSPKQFLTSSSQSFEFSKNPFSCDNQPSFLVTDKISLLHAVKALSQVSSNEYEEFVKSIGKHYDFLSDVSWNSIIESLSKVKISEHKLFLENAQHLLRIIEIENNPWENFSDEVELALIDIKNFSWNNLSAEYKLFIELTQRLSNSRFDIKDLMVSFSNISPLNQEKFIKFVENLLTLNISSEEKIRAIIALSCVNSSDYSVFKENIHSLINLFKFPLILEIWHVTRMTPSNTQATNEEVSFKVLLIEIFAKLTSQQRQKFIETISQFEELTRNKLMMSFLKFPYQFNFDKYLSMVELVKKLVNYKINVKYLEDVLDIFIVTDKYTKVDLISSQYQKTMVKKVLKDKIQSPVIIQALSGIMNLPDYQLIVEGATRISLILFKDTSLKRALSIFNFENDQELDNREKILANIISALSYINLIEKRREVCDKVCFLLDLFQERENDAPIQNEWLKRMVKFTIRNKNINGLIELVGECL